MLCILFVDEAEQPGPNCHEADDRAYKVTGAPPVAISFSISSAFYIWLPSEMGA